VPDASWDPFGPAGWVASRSSVTQPQQQQQQQQQAVVVQAVDRTGATSGNCRQLEVPGQVVSALSELQLTGAVGWLRLVRLPPPAAAGPTAGMLYCCCLSDCMYCTAVVPATACQHCCCPSNCMCCTVALLFPQQQLSQEAAARL
jgi:hypothetical protein